MFSTSSLSSFSSRPYRSEFSEDGRKLFGDKRAHVFFGSHGFDDVREYLCKLVERCLLSCGHMRKSLPQPGKLKTAQAGLRLHPRIQRQDSPLVGMGVMRWTKGGIGGGGGLICNFALLARG